MSDYVDELIELNEEKVIEMTEKRLEQGEDALKIVDDVKKAVKEIGDRYERNEYFLPELTMAGEILEQIFDRVKPKLEEGRLEEGKKGKILLGTVEEDIHDIGKNVVKFMLDTDGYDVIDLGVDVPPEEFVEKIEEYRPDIVALSGLLTLAYDSMKNTIEAIEEADLRDAVKIMIGGGSTDETIVDYTGADDYGETAVDAVRLADKWIGED